MYCEFKTKVFLYCQLCDLRNIEKPLQYCKVISLQLIKINGKKKWEKNMSLFTILHVNSSVKNNVPVINMYKNYQKSSN